MIPCRYICTKFFCMSRSVLSVLLISVVFAACSTNNVTVDDSIGKYFDSAGVHGCFGLFDNGQGHFTIYNLPRFRDSSYSPGATFDILQSLIAFQTGTLKDDKAVLLVADSVGGITITQAFRTISLVNYVVFNRLADSLGKDS